MLRDFDHYQIYHSRMILSMNDSDMYNPEKRERQLFKDILG